MLKLIPDVDGKPKIAQLVGLHITEVTVKGSWSGPARLHLVPHVNAPVADLPVRKVLGGRAFCGRSHPAGRPCAGRLHEELNDRSGPGLGRARAVR